MLHRRFLLLCIASALLASLPSTRVASLVSWRNGNATLAFSSASFFQTSSPQFSRSNCAVATISSVAPGCSFEAVALPAVRNAANQNCTAIVLESAVAFASGCQTVSQIADSVFDTLVPRLRAAGFPIPTAPASSDSRLDPLLILADRSVDNDVAGGPLNTRFHAQSMDASTSPPRIDLILLGREPLDTGLAQAALVDVTQEPGTWNIVFGSAPFQAYTWIVLAFVCVMLAYAILELVWCVRQGTTKRLDQRMVIYLFGLASASMVAASLAMRRETWAVYFLNVLSTFMFHVAFILLLQLWFGIASRVHSLPTRYAIVFVIALFTLSAVFRLVSGTLWITLGYTDLATQLHLACHVVSLVSQGIMGVMFGGYGFFFLWRRRALNVSRRNYRALTKLAWLALTCIIAFALRTTIETAVISKAGNSSVAFVGFYYVGGDVAAVVRVLAILMILGVRIPERRSAMGIWKGWFITLGDGVKDRLSSIITSSTDRSQTSTHIENSISSRQSMFPDDVTMGGDDKPADSSEKARASGEKKRVSFQTVATVIERKGTADEEGLYYETSSSVYSSDEDLSDDEETAPNVHSDAFSSRHNPTEPPPDANYEYTVEEETVAEAGGQVAEQTAVQDVTMSASVQVDRESRTIEYDVESPGGEGQQLELVASQRGVATSLSHETSTVEYIEEIVEEHATSLGASGSSIGKHTYESRTIEHTSGQTVVTETVEYVVTEEVYTVEETIETVQESGN